MTDIAKFAGHQLPPFLLPELTNQARRRSSGPLLPLQTDSAPAFLETPRDFIADALNTTTFTPSPQGPSPRGVLFQTGVAIDSIPDGALSSQQLLSASFPGGTTVQAGGSLGGCCACNDCARLADSTDEVIAAWASNDQAPIVMDGVVSLGAGVDLSRTFQLHSNPYATKTIFLDFDGFDINSTLWEEGGALRLGAFFSSFDTTALTGIQRIWQRVAEDFSPFDINVTTEDPGSDNLRKSGAGDTRWGIRVAFTKNLNLLTGKAISNAGGGGTAYYNSFNWSTDDVALVFNSSEYSAAETASHEVGHTLGLTHDGSSGTSYYAGHGSGATGWGTIMGAPFQGTNENVTQWSKGQYYGANNAQDDLAAITAGNGFSYAADDHGNSFGSATALSGSSFSSFGVIERSSDIDMFRFDTGAGLVSFDIVNASRAFIGSGDSFTTEYLAARGPNLDISASLYRANGSLLQTFNPAALTTAGFSIALEAGTYYLGIDGVGAGDPFASTPTGYTDYGSLGQYMLTGTVQATTTTSTSIPPPPPPLPAPAILVMTGGDLVTTEARGSASFQVGLSRAPANDVIIQILSSDSGEGIVRKRELVFTAANWQTLQTVTIEGVDDTLVDGSQAYSILLSSTSSDPAFNGLSGPTVSVQNSDNDVATPPTSGPITFLASAGKLTSSVSYVQAPTVTGALKAIHASDDQRLAITEGSFLRRGSTAISLNAYVWTFDNLRDATQLVFEGYRNAGSNDNFRIQYSTNGGRTWATALTISNTSERTFTSTLPSPVNGTVLVRTLDTRGSAKDNSSYDTIYVDRLVFEGRSPAATGQSVDPLTGTADNFALDPGRDDDHHHGDCEDVLPEDLTITSAPFHSLEGMACCGEAGHNPTPVDPLASVFPAVGSAPSPTTSWLDSSQPLL